MQRDRAAGFSLMEIMVVLVVISILVGLLFPALRLARERARKNRAATEIRELQKAWQVYFTTHEEFPANGESEMTKDMIKHLAGEGPDGIVFMEFPEDALGDDSEKNGFRDPWGNYYRVDFNVSDTFTKKAAYESRVHCVNAQRYKY